MADVTTTVSPVRDGTLLHLILDAPERRNALSLAMLGALNHELRNVESGLTGVVISGRGTVFSAGGDFADLRGNSSDVRFDDAISEVTSAIRQSPLVVVAAIEGPCIGAAADVALSCDVRVAAARSYFQVPAVRLGLLYNPSALAELAESFSAHAIRRLMLLGEAISSPEALALGFASHLSPAGESAETALGLLRGITTEELPAIAATKAFLRSQTQLAPVSPVWEERRRNLLDSPEREALVMRAKRRFGDRDGPRNA